MPKDSLDALDPKKFIIINGAKVNNLQNISLAIPKNKFVVITGLSGSGKSSLAFDTLYADGQRRYVESLSSYARQFLGRMSKPEVDYIKGIAPAIAIEQKVNTRNPRSTVGTSTEIYEYLKLFFSRIGKTYSPKSGKEVKRHNVSDVVDFFYSLPEGAKVMIISPLIKEKDRSLLDHLKILMQQGFARIAVQEQVHRIEDMLNNGALSTFNSDDLDVVIDRLTVKHYDEDLRTRLADSVQIGFYEGDGECIVEYLNKDKAPIRKSFSNKFDLDGITFEEPTPNLFSFNNPFGACKKCEGFGSIIGIDEDLVIPNKSLSIYEDAIACWRGEKMSEWKDQLVMNAYKFDFPIHKPIYELTPEQKKLLWTGNRYFNGLDDFFRYVESKSYKIQYRVMLSRYRGKTVCPDCQGTRLRKDANYVKVGGKSITDLVLLPIKEVIPFFNNLQLNRHDLAIATRLLVEIKNRLSYLSDVGLGYLTLNRLSSSLSGGESQRINLATSLGSNLVGSMYILDEPSIGLHPRDTHRLIKVLKQLKNLGNTVIVVEHDEEIIKAADEIIDMGPLAGNHGGKIIFQGNYQQLLDDKESLTAQYMNREKAIDLPDERRRWKEYIEVKGAREHNLKNLQVKIPLNVLTVISGVSGSGKTTLIKHIFYRALKKHYGGYSDKTGDFDRLDGDMNSIAGVELVDQNPIGRSSRSNPATYVKAYDEIRALFADQALAKMRGYKPGFFSFNTEGGRCDECEGEGVVKIEMQFMADIELTCEECNGSRFKNEVLEIKYKEKSIADVLDMTVNEAIDFFKSGKEKDRSTVEKRIIGKLQPLVDVGLGYVKLGQSSSTLSGGEAQRIKLAFFLSKGYSHTPTLFIFDEPTTGLHFHDINKLLKSLRALIENGHSILIIEHNMEIIKSADWVIDLGPEGGEKGGHIICEGTPEDVVKVKSSYTAGFLSEKV
ncbi:MAG: excinuclease ABC subunit UvrA [Bacteroidales bacterium]|nr:excinuclease ABC subunit UvrA [Bacteroidales bacterium]